MYWPYLRNRTNELFAVKEIATKIAPGRLVVPIFQLNALDKDFKNRSVGIAKLGQRFCLLVNANSNVTLGDAAAFLLQLEADYPGIALPGIEIKGVTPLTDLQGFVANFSGQQCVVVHREPWGTGNVHGHLSGLALPPVHIFLATKVHLIPAPTISAGNVILTDGFLRQTTNGAYPAQSAFNNNATSYHVAGYKGFGDFAAIGDYYKKGGGQASHVTLHLTQFSGNSMMCNHFVSHSTPTSAHISFKYKDALAQLRSYALPTALGFHTVGVADYHASHKFHGLGMAKRWSLKHHLELMNDFLTARKVVPFV